MASDQPLRWGILGAASIARSFAEGVRLSAGNRVEAIASRSMAKAEAWAAEHGVPHAYDSYEALLESGAVDAIYNPLPNSLHAEWTIKALEKGLPVLCEKPFAATAGEARDVVRVSERTGVPVAEAFMYRFHPMYDRLLQMLGEAAIGRLTSIHSQFTWFCSDRREIPASADLAGGALMDVGCYCVNLSRLVTGREPLRVSAFERRSTVDDTLFGLMEFPGGVLASFETSIENYERHRVEIAGTEGMIVLDRPWNPGDDEARFTFRRGSWKDTIATPGANRFQREVEDFERVVRNGAPPRWPIADAVANMAAIDALYVSAREGRAVAVLL
ncbi:MAG: Gfo/Idh/MocA family oxidoreductase [Candidatus Hydrogenedentes bacterium]|nr:Gfo/Idh/MocA family oxidoreductase [Candidatus Hydrogenedentota bacterium]